VDLARCLAICFVFYVCMTWWAGFWCSVACTHALMCFLSFVESSGGHLVLHSFPTRRSSDLVAGRADRGHDLLAGGAVGLGVVLGDRKSTRLNSSHVKTSYAVFCLKKRMCFSCWLPSIFTMISGFWWSRVT